MKKILVWIAIASSAMALAGSYPANVIIGKKVAGTGTIVESFSAKTGGSDKAMLTIKAPTGQEVTVTQGATYNAAGVTTKKFMEVTTAGQHIVITCLIKGKTAHCSIKANGQTKTQEVTAPANANVKDPTNLWLKSVTPHMNQTVKYVDFDPQSLQWLPVQATYKGKAEITIGSKHVHCFKIVSVQTQSGTKTEQTIYLDSKGELVQLVTPGMTIQRRY